MQAVLVIYRIAVRRLQALQALFCAEAIIGIALGDQLLRVLHVNACAAALGLYIRAHAPVLVRSLVIIKPCRGKRAVDDIYGAFHKALLIRILYAQHEAAARMPRDQIGIQRSAQITHMHPSCGTRCKSCLNHHQLYISPHSSMPRLFR